MNCNQETKAATTSDDDNSNAVGSHPDTMHGKTSEAAKALDNQDKKINRTNSRPPKVMIDVNTCASTSPSPRP